MRKRLLFLLILVLMEGCRVHRPLDVSCPRVKIPKEYCAKERGTQVIGRWWEEFHEEQLNCLIKKALRNNLDLAQAWDRLAQAKAQAVIDGAERYPQIDMTNSVINSHSSGRGFGTGALTGFDVPGVPITEFPATTANGSVTRYLLSFDLAYEVDLWRRIDAKTKAGVYNVLATWEDLEATALLLTGTVTDLWFTIQEQKALLELFAYQIEVNQTLLELVELRFSIGEASALDVYQQRLQLAETETQVPSVQALLSTSSHQMAILLGEPPCEPWLKKSKILSKPLPTFPNMGTPWDLICCRPDLRAARRRLQQTDYLVAEAVADQFPKFTILLSYDFSALRFRDIFDQELLSIASNLVYPLVDGCRRAAEVDRRKSVVAEQLNAFGEDFLNALKEVEDAIVDERYQLELIQYLEKQTELAEANLREARRRYQNGLSDYLPVIAAIQSLQNVQRSTITEQKRLHQTRAKLYRALGGSCVR